MTWKEFKELVEKHGVKDEDEIFYIDSYPHPDTYDPMRFVRGENGWEIWG